MSDRAKELILKVLIVIVNVLAIGIFPGSIAIALLIKDPEVASIVFYTIFFSCMAVGVLFIILLFVFGGLKQKTVKAEKFH